MKDNEKNVIKIKLSTFIILVVLLIIIIFIGVNLYANAQGKSNFIFGVKNSEKEETNRKENMNSSDVNGKEGNEIIKYPETLGAIFNYDNGTINQTVSNKTSDITYIGEPRNSNPYEISRDRKNITINGTILSFETEIYHACVYPLGQGGIDMWVILLRDGTVKYTTDYGETMKTGGNHIIDVFPIEYEVTTNDEIASFMGGATILIANEFGALIDLGILNSEN